MEYILVAVAGSRAIDGRAPPSPTWSIFSSPSTSRAAANFGAFDRHCLTCTIFADSCTQSSRRPRRLAPSQSITWTALADGARGRSVATTFVRLTRERRVRASHPEHHFPPFHFFSPLGPLLDPPLTKFFNIFSKSERGQRPRESPRSPFLVSPRRILESSLQVRTVLPARRRSRPTCCLQPSPAQPSPAQLRFPLKLFSRVSR